MEKSPFIASYVFTRLVTYLVNLIAAVVTGPIFPATVYIFWNNNKIRLGIIIYHKIYNFFKYIYETKWTKQKSKFEKKIV